MTDRADLERQIALQEAAILQLINRVTALEAALSFEIDQRNAMEQVILHLTDLPRRMTRAEFRIRSAINRLRSK